MCASLSTGILSAQLVVSVRGTISVQQSRRHCWQDKGSAAVCLWHCLGTTGWSYCSWLQWLWWRKRWRRRSGGSQAEARLLVRHLPQGQRQRLRTFALCLVQAQRRAGATLPAELKARLLAAAGAPAVAHVPHTCAFLMTCNCFGAATRSLAQTGLSITARHSTAAALASGDMGAV
jgi:hypothetical protein